MRIETLKTFRDLIETGNFSKAAALNFVSQPAVIHRKGEVFSAAAREFTNMPISA